MNWSVPSGGGARADDLTRRLTAAASPWLAVPSPLGTYIARAQVAWARKYAPHLLQPWVTK